MAYTDDQDFQPISPYEGYTSDQIRGFVDKSLSNILGKEGLGQGFKVDTGDNYRTVGWQDKGFTPPEVAPDDVPQIFWNPETKEITQLPTGGYIPPEGWQFYSGQYTDRIDVPDFGVEPTKIIKERGERIDEDFEGNPEITPWWKESVNPEWYKWKQKLDEFSASLPDVDDEYTPEVPRGPTYDLAFDRSAATGDTVESQLLQMFQDSGRKIRFDPDSKNILIDNRPIQSIGDFRDLYKENIHKTGKTLNVTPGMQAIDFYRDSLLGSSATDNFYPEYTVRALSSIYPDTSYLDAMVHNEKIRSDKDYKDTIEGNINDAVLLTKEYVQSVRDQIPGYSTATPWSGGAKFFEKTRPYRPYTPEDYDDDPSDESQ